MYTSRTVTHVNVHRDNSCLCNTAVHQILCSEVYVPTELYWSFVCMSVMLIAISCSLTYFKEWNIVIEKAQVEYTQPYTGFHG